MAVWDGLGALGLRFFWRLTLLVCAKHQQQHTTLKSQPQHYNDTIILKTKAPRLPVRVQGHPLRRREGVLREGRQGAPRVQGPEHDGRPVAPPGGRHEAPRRALRPRRVKTETDMERERRGATERGESTDGTRDGTRRRKERELFVTYVCVSCFMDGAVCARASKTVTESFLFHTRAVLEGMSCLCATVDH